MKVNVLISVFFAGLVIVMNLVLFDVIDFRVFVGYLFSGACSFLAYVSWGMFND